MTDEQWAVIDPLLPDPASPGGEGRPKEWCRRDIVDAIFYLVDNGGKWPALPADFPPWQTVYTYLATWEKNGITQQLLDALRDRVRIAEGRTAEPSAAIIDSQSVKAAEEASKNSRGLATPRAVIKARLTPARPRFRAPQPLEIAILPQRLRTEFNSK